MNGSWLGDRDLLRLKFKDILEEIRYETAVLMMAEGFLQCQHRVQ